VVAAMTSGVAMDPKELATHGKRGKQRSIHNTYFTLPVIFAMLSNHYSFLYTHEHRWVLRFVMKQPCSRQTMLLRCSPVI
jgi:uncharacterized membrane protein